ncbi:MAG: WecB/TagA/CpsF family glycosyltransferase [Acidobacteria bacterium]|nr:WecB/TagA/CpsF family glycosyltransferase [Acidobacteriota bacterium]
MNSIYSETRDVFIEHCSELKRDFLGIELSVITREQLLKLFCQSLETRSKLTISFLNPNYAVYAKRNPKIITAMNAFDILLADAVGVVKGARFLGLPIPEKLGNDDIGEDLFAICAEKGYSNFLFGSAPGVAERAAVNLQRSFPEVKIAGTLHGHWFKFLETNLDATFVENEKIVASINRAGADVLWVGLSTPLQQFWVHQNRARVDATVIITGGGYLDHLAERIRWYPPVFYKWGLTWLYRLLREPGRLWRRYSIEMIVFAGMLIRARATMLKARAIP